jgi:anionic cell wall polymer biosynthesis LytR-Cps2A-Psr (LCP) family protein
MRTQRQRTVLLAIAEKVKTASPATLNKIANDVFSEVYTSLDLSEIVELLGEVNKYQVVAQGGFPEETMRATGTVGAKGSCVIPRSLESNVKWLHEFLFEDEDYTPSEAVKEYSNKVAADTNSYVN